MPLFDNSDESVLLKLASTGRQPLLGECSCVFQSYINNSYIFITNVIDSKVEIVMYILLQTLQICS